MGTSTDAILAYGYALPGEGGDLPDVEWFDEDSEDDFGDALAQRLRDTGTTGVHLVSHCSVNYPMYILATSSTTAWRGSPVAVDPNVMVTQRWAGEWDAKLDHAMRVLGLTSTQSRPEWLLCSDWG